MDFKKYYFIENQIDDWHQYLSSNPYLQTAVEVLIKLDSTSMDTRSYIVGGAVRDIIMNNPFNDIDIATNVPMEVTEKLFKTHDIGKNKDFGILVIDYKGFTFEIANFRSDGTYSDGRRPDTIKIELDFKADASRRDITINSMGINQNGEIIDYFDGQKDIKNKILRMVGDPEKRIGEDSLRLLRNARFAARLGFTLSSETIDAMKKHSPEINRVSAERISKELMAMAKESGETFANAIKILDETGILQYILPEVSILKQYPHSELHHPEGERNENGEPTVFGHVIEALKTSVGKDAIVNLAILLHDIGKSSSHHIDDKGIHRYFGHAEKAIEIINNIADRLKLDNQTREALIYSASNHMKFHDLLKMKNQKVARLMSSPNWDILKSVAEADAKARGDLFDQNQWNQIEKKIIDLKNRFGNNPNVISAIKKVVNGDLVMKIKGITKPGPEIGKSINTVIDQILDKNIDLNDMETITKLIKRA